MTCFRNQNHFTKKKLESSDICVKWRKNAIKEYGKEEGKQGMKNGNSW